MDNKGLCINCAHDKTCSFVRFPLILQCEEFDIASVSTAEQKLQSLKKSAQYKPATEQEYTVE